MLTIGSTSADNHAAICATLFNWWYNIADNNGPVGYRAETANQKLIRLKKDANVDEVSPCDMQRNANAYHRHFKDKLLDARGIPHDEGDNLRVFPGSGFPFADQDPTLFGLTPTCELEPVDLGANAFGGPISSCAFGYPGNKNTTSPETIGLPSTTTFDNNRSLCRLKILGFGDGVNQELQWCMTNILGTMKIGVEGEFI